MSLAKRTLSGLGKVGIVIGIVVAFIIGLAGTVYLSLRSPEVKVPEVVGKDRMAAEEALNDAGLNVRIRATRPVSDAKPDTVILQLPRAGEVVKAGQTVAIDLSRAAKEGETAISTASLNAKQEQDKQADTTKTDQPASNQNENQNQNQNANQNQNQNKQKKNKNTNIRNANSSNSANGNNSNAANNGNRNVNGNANANRSINANNRNLNINNRNANANINRNINLNTNRRAPVTTTPPFVNPSNRRTP